MSRRDDAIDLDKRVCQWISLDEALYHFATYDGPTQSQQHIKPLHWYIASRLVLEGGFRPEEITPRPPFRRELKKGKHVLIFDPAVATGSERTVLGGLKTKNVDVVVAKDGLGPVFAVSCKGMTGALRNLTNRMEETIGECTNLHITYPALVFGYMFAVRANREEVRVAQVAAAAESGIEVGKALKANDIAVNAGGEPVVALVRFHSALRELSGRQGIRNDVSRYEAVSLLMMETTGEGAGKLTASFPAEESALRFERFFQTLYLRYEERFLLGAPDLKAVTARLKWAPDSPALSVGPTPDFSLRLDADDA